MPGCAVEKLDRHHLALSMCCNIYSDHRSAVMQTPLKKSVRHAQLSRQHSDSQDKTVLQPQQCTGRPMSRILSPLPREGASSSPGVASLLQCGVSEFLSNRQPMFEGLYDARLTLRVPSFPQDCHIVIADACVNSLDGCPP